MPSQNAQVEKLTRRVTALYSLPAVAMEVVRLTERDDIDTAALRDCIEKDPALTAKVLRVVNSSLFGLSGKVADLNQALAMLGTGPLKLLVLGFSLPEKLFQTAAKEQLEWYWTTCLTRAVAARQLSKSLWDEPGDEAFLAGLLQDIGLLALIGQLDEAFAAFFNRLIAEHKDVARAEQEVLGFDHRELSVALFKHWNLPPLLADAVAMPALPLRLARLNTEAAKLAKVLHLAELLSQLVGQNRIRVLPDLLENGRIYCDLTKPKLFEIVSELQPQVDQLAGVLSLDLPTDRDYHGVLLEAYTQVSQFAQDAVEPFAASHSAGEVCDALLVESEELRRAMTEFIESQQASPSAEVVEDDAEPKWDAHHGAHQRTAGERRSAVCESPLRLTTGSLLQEIAAAARGCRMRRSELSLLWLEVERLDELPPGQCNRMLETLLHAVRSTCRDFGFADMEIHQLTSSQLILIVPGCDRREAVNLANTLVMQIAQLNERADLSETLLDLSINAAAATVASVLKNFAPEALLEGASRCLHAARACGGNAVKSIEVY